MKYVSTPTTLVAAVLATSVWAESEPELPLASPLTFDEAISIALAAQPGTIAEVALERSNDQVVIEIEVVNDAGDEVEFQLDAQSGQIIATWTDDDPSDDPDATTDSDG